MLFQDCMSAKEPEKLYSDLWMDILTEKDHSAHQEVSACTQFKYLSKLKYTFYTS